MELTYDVIINTDSAKGSAKELERMFDQMAKSSDKSVQSLSAYGKDFVTQLQSGKLSVKDIDAYIKSLRSDIVKLYKSGDTGNKETKKQIRDVSHELQILRREIANVNAESNRMQAGGGIYGKLGALAGGYLSISALTNLSRQIMNVRGQFQQLEISFSTMLGSEEKAIALMDQLVETAAKTPFDLQSISQGAKQLLAYGEASETVNDTLVRLGNIASGLSIPLNDLVYLYGTTQVQGRVFTQDIRQFLGRGIPIVKEMSKQLGVTEEEINKMVTAGKIGFKEVKDALEAMTNEGGMFYNLMEKQSASLTGQLSNLEDAFDSMLNEIGKATQGAFSQGISLVSTLVENYKTIGKVILSVAEAYGIYKAALMAAYVAENRARLIRLAHIKVIQMQTAAQSLLNKVMKANPYVLVASAIVTLIALSATWREKVDHSAKAQEELNKELEDSKNAIKANEDAVRASIGVIQDKTKSIYEQIEAYDILQSKEGFFKGKSIEEIQAMNPEQVRDQITKDSWELGRKEAKRILDEAKQARQIAEARLADYKKNWNQTSSVAMLNKYQDAVFLATEKEKAALKEYNKTLADIAAKEEAVAFQRLTTEEKIGLLKRRNADLQSSINALEAKNGVNPITKRSNLSITELDKLESYKKKLAENDRQLSALTATDTKDYEYWEQRKKDATEAFHRALPGTKEFKEAKANIEEAIRQMKAWEDQTEKNDESLKRLRESLKDMAFKASLLANLEGKTGFEEQRAAAQNDYDTKIYESDKQRSTMLAVQGITSADRQEINARFDEYNKGLMEAHRKTLAVIDEEKKEFKESLKNAIGDYWMTELDKEMADIEKWAKEKIKDIRKNLKKEEQSAYESDINRLKDIKVEDAQLKETIRLINEEGEAREHAIEIAGEYAGTERKEIALKESQRETLRKTIDAIKAQNDISEEELRQLRELEFQYARLGVAIDKARIDLEKYNEEARKNAIIEGIASLGGAFSSSENPYASALGSLLGSVQGFQDMARLRNQRLELMKAEDQAWLNGDFAGADLARSGQQAAKSQAMAGAISSAAQFAAFMVDQGTAIADTQRRLKESAEEWKRSVEDVAHEYTMIKLDDLEYQQRNMFGVEDPYKKLQDNAKKYEEASKATREALEKLSVEGVVKVGQKAKADMATAASDALKGAAMGAMAGSVAGPWGTAIGAAAGAIGGFITGVFRSREMVDVFDNLKSKFGEVFDPDTLEINKEILASYDQLDDRTKKLVDNYKELKERMDEAKEDFKEYAKELFGEVGNELADILADAFRNDRLFESVNDFRDYVKKQMESIISSKIYSAVFGNMFDGLDAKVDEALENYSRTGGNVDFVGLLGELPYKTEQLIGAYGTLMKQAQEALPDWDMFNPTDSQEALRGSIASMSEDTASKLNGNFMGLKLSAMEINTKMSSVRSLMEESQSIMGRSLSALHQIADNTAHLLRIDESIADMRNEMINNGVRVR